MGHNMTEQEQLRYLARIAVDRRISDVLAVMPCFCTRLDADALAGDVQQAMEIEA